MRLECLCTPESTHIESGNSYYRRGEVSSPKMSPGSGFSRNFPSVWRIQRLIRHPLRSGDQGLFVRDGVLPATPLSALTDDRDVACICTLSFRIRSSISSNCLLSLATELEQGPSLPQS